MSTDLSIWQSQDSAWQARKAIYENQQGHKALQDLSQSSLTKISNQLSSIDHTEDRATQRNQIRSALEEIKTLQSKLASSEPKPLSPQYPRKTAALAGRHSCTNSCTEFCSFIRSRMSSALNGNRLNAILDLEDFEDFSHYRKQLFSKDKGNIRRLLSKTEATLDFQEIEPTDYITDIDRILSSAPERQGGRIRPPYNQGARFLLNLYNHEKPKEACPTNQHFAKWFGVTKNNAGRKLIAFLMVERAGEIAHYRHILGDQAHLREGAMYFMHLEFIKHLYNTEERPRYISYAQWTDHPLLIDLRPGLTLWKKKCLFKPTILLEIPVRNKEILLHWVKSQSKKSLFPEEAFDDVTSCLFAFAAGYLGRRDVIHALKKPSLQTTVVDNDAHMMEVMAHIYPDSWCFKTQEFWDFVKHSQDAKDTWDAVVADPWAYQEDEVAKRVSDLYKIASKRLVLSLTKKDFFEPNNLPTTVEALSKYFRSKSDRIKNVRLYQSSPANGGCYWSLIDFSR